MSLAPGLPVVPPMADKSTLPLAQREVLGLHVPRTLGIMVPANLCQAYRGQGMPPPVCMCISWIAKEAPDFCARPALPSPRLAPSSAYPSRER